MAIKNKYDMIREPIITEKSNNLGELGKYVFKVSPEVNKGLVKVAIEEIFDVKVMSVHIANIKGKVKKFKGFLGRRTDTKKAIVTLAKGQVIDFSGGVK